MYFDSHCHLDRIDLASFNDSFSNLLKDIQAEQVTRMVCISVNLESFDAMYELIAPHDHIYCSAGVHPDYKDVTEPTVGALCTLVEKEKVVAVGETGLDYIESSSNMEWQRQRFITHIEAARECKLPLIIHSRNAKQDTLDLLKQHKAHDVGGVLHCFTEDWDMAEREFFMLSQATERKALYDMYLERVNHFRREPPPADWDGVFTFTTK